MRENQNIKVCGSKVVLVPYQHEHVLKYHSWMESEELRSLTASERLSEEQEYDMQKSWLQDPDKCTFIVLNRSVYDESCGSEVDSMVGDVNLYFNDSDTRARAELEIMIAELSVRGRGFGKEATLAMIKYGYEHLSVREFIVKIGDKNSASINLFSKLGFHQISHSAVFEEITLLLSLYDDVSVSNLLLSTNHLTILPYSKSQQHCAHT